MSDGNAYQNWARIDNASNQETACLIRCPPEECGTDTCCPPVTGKLVDVDEHDESGHDGHDHSHAENTT